jgi:uncharacterized protein (TIGR03437 family)
MPAAITATYIRAARITVLTDPLGLKVKVDGRDNWTSFNFMWGLGETHHLDASARQTDAQGRTWAFTGWSDAGAAAHDFTVPGDSADLGVRVTATFAPVGHLTVTSALSQLTVRLDGNDCATPCEVFRPVGTGVRLSAPASVPLGDGSRADFRGWSGGGAETSVTLGADPVTMSADYRLMNRLVTSADPAEAALWKIQPPSADAFYDSATTVSVAVSANPGFRFRRWDGDLSGSTASGAVSMSSPKSVRAIFDRIPFVPPSGIVNAAGNTPALGVAPGSIASIFGASLASGTATGPDSPLAQTLSGVTVRIADRLFPLFFVSPGQINIEIPPDLALGGQVLTISSTGQPDIQLPFTALRNAPGLFEQDGIALVFHQDGSPVSTDSPAHRGELLSLYGTGFGPTNRPRPLGFPIPDSPPFLLVDPISVLVADASVASESASAAAGRSGVDIVQFRVDGTVASGVVPLHIQINGADSNEVKIPIE